MSPLQRKLRRALGSFKDQTSIGLAIVASNGAPDLEVALVKATSHEEAPIEEKYIQEILQLTSYSRGYVNACVAGLAKRLSKTHNWVVAIKALMLIQRLLHDGDSSFEEELLLAGRRGTTVLNLSNFRDDSHSNAWDYSAFVRTYALFLDELLDYNVNGKSHLEGSRSFNDRGSSHGGYGSFNDRGSSHGGYGSFNNGDRRRGLSEGNWNSTTVKDMKPHELLAKIPLMQRMVERVLACRPTGAARMNRLVQIALYPAVRESFQFYTDICDGLAIILDAFFDMDHVDCVKAFELHARAAKQVDELASFYSFCKNLGVCRSSEYPMVQKISEDLLDTMEDFLRDRLEAGVRYCRQRSPEPKPRSPVREPEADEARYEVNGMKALPAPPVEESDQAPSLQQQEGEGDLLEVEKATVSTEDYGDKLALALFADTGSSANQNGEALGGQSAGDGSAGWELALLAASSELSKPNQNIKAGGFDHFLLDSMYEQRLDLQKLAASIPSGSASSVALPGRPASAFLALPAPMPLVGEDPFTASLPIPPPSYVQMADMTQKQQLLVQEQQIWYQYQRDGMQGHHGFMKLYNNGYPFQPAYPVPYVRTSYY